MFKKFLSFFMLLMTVVGSVRANEVVGSMGANYLADASTPIALTNGSTIHYQFTQNTTQGENWYGWILLAKDGNSSWTTINQNVLIALRQDNYEVVAGNNNGCSNNYNWSSFQSEMNGAAIDMYVSFSNGTFSMTSTITSSTNQTYNYSYTKSGMSNNELKIALGMEKAVLNISSVTSVIRPSLTKTASITANSSNVVTVTTNVEKEYYNRQTSSGNRGYAFAEFPISIPSGQTISSATLTSKIHAHGKSGSNEYGNYLYYLNSELSIDNIESSNSVDDYRFNNKKEQLFYAAPETAGDYSGSTDVTDAVKALQSQGKIIFQWTASMVAGDQYVYGAGSSDAPVLSIETNIEDETNESSTEANHWDFTTGWTTADLSAPAKLDGLTIVNNNGSSDNYWIIDNRGIRLRDKNATTYITIPAKKGQIVTIHVDTSDGSNHGSESVNISGADKESVGGLNGFNQPRVLYCIATSDNGVTIHRGDDNNSIGYLCISKIRVDDAPMFIYNGNKYSVIADAGNGSSGFDLSAELIDLQFDEPTLSAPEGASVSYKSGNTKIAYCPQNQPQTIDGVTWKAEPDQVGQVRFINTNYATVIAKVSYGGYTWGSTQEGDQKDLKYRVLVSADDVDSGTDDLGTTFKIIGNTNPNAPKKGGKLLSQDVHMPFLTARFGPDDVVNTSIVRDEPGIGLVITTLARDGWRDAYFQDVQNPKKPTQGTFYKFMPTAPGDLTVVGYIDSSAGGKAVLVDANANYAEVTPTNGSLDWSSNTTKMTTKFTLHKDHVYYLFGSNPNYDSNNNVWATYQLQSFTFESTFGFDTKSVVLRNGETTTQQIVDGALGTVNYSFTPKGDLTFNGDPSTGNITNISGNGGAIVVTATDGGSNGTGLSDFYVVTVPYATNTWNFETATDLDVNDSRDYAVTYKVRNYYEYAPRHLYYLNVPVLSNKTGLSGENAAYFGETAGLILSGGVKTLGVTASVNTNTVDELTPEQKADPAILDRALKTMLAYGQNDINWSSIVFLTMQKGAKLTIPNLKGGQYVRIKWARYYEKEGEFVRVTNLQDLDGNDINPIVPVRTGAPQQANSLGYRNGYTVFKVKGNENENVDVTFEVTDEGWVNFYSIEVKNSFTGNTYKQIYEDIENHPEYANTTDTDLRLVIGQNTAGTNYSHNYGETGTVTYQNDAQQHFQVGYGVHFSLEPKDANTPIPSASIETSGSSKVRRAPSLVTTSITDEGVLTTAGQGQAVVVQKATEVDSLGNTLVLDMQRTLITITQDVDITWDYPYTWDFTNISTKTLSDIGAANGGTGNANWQKNNDGSFKATDSFKDSFVQGGMLSSTGTYENLSTDATAQSGTGNRISEYEGLGFRTETEAASASGLDYIGITVPTDQPGEHGGAGGMVIGDKETTIVVPDVPEGMTVYVRVEPQENASVDVDGNTTKDFSATNTTTNKSEDVYSTTTAEAGDVELKLQNVVVKGIAVSNFKKTCYFRQGDTHVYYNTDSHALPIDYTLTKYYTNNAILAYEVYSISDKSVTLGLVEKGPENTGYVVSTEYLDDNTVQRPLFVPCANDIKNNMDEISTYSKATLLPHVEAGAIEGGAANRDHTHYDYYVLTNIYYQINQETDEFVSGPKTASVPGFYRVVSGDNSSLNRYRAYLKLPKSTTTLSGVKAIPLFDFDGELVDAIDVVSANATVGIDVNGTFYTLQGMKIQGLPKQGGVYIQNGKKVLVK